LPNSDAALRAKVS
jgi:hypothetical protein